MSTSRHPAATTATSALVLTALMGAGALPAAAASNHTVVRGDTLSGIAAKNGVSLASVFAANGMGMNTVIYPGQTVLLEAAGKPAPNAPAAPAGASVHKVVPGDTLSGIAARHGVSLAAVFAANGMGMNTVIHPGQTINLGTSATEPVIASPAPVQPSVPVSTARAYTVVPGDTMTAIARTHGVSLASLLQSNGMKASAVIYVGQRISVPGPGTAPAPAPVQSAPTPSPAPVSGASLQDQVRATATAMNVDPVLALAVAHQESGFRQNVVSPAGAIGTMQVMPGSGIWASELVGRTLDLQQAGDNITAGVAILSALVRTSGSLDDAIASYYQGQYSVQTIGYYDDTKAYVASVKGHMARFR